MFHVNFVENTDDMLILETGISQLMDKYLYIRMQLAEAASTS